MEERRPVLDPDTIRALVRLMDENALTELTVEEEGCLISLKADGVVPGVQLLSVPLAPVAPAETPAPEEDASRVRVQAPMTGVFYRSPSPTEPPFVEVDDAVEAGQVIGVIEAMKVFSEVPSEVAGRIVAIPAKNGELVNQEDTLMVLAVEDEAHAG